PRVDRRDRRAGEVLDAREARLLRHGDVEPARAEAELEQLFDTRSALAHEILAGDPAVDDAVLYVLRDVGRAYEQHVDRCVAAGKRECTLARLLRPEAGILEQRDRRFAQPPLDGDGDPQPVAFACLRRSSTTWYPSSPCRSQCPT